MSQETGDTFFGAIVLIVFLIFVFALGFLISKFKNARFAKVWTPLIPVVGGKVSEDNGGSTSSFLTGSYAGRTVRATMAPQLNRYSESGSYYNYFDITMAGVPGRQNWQLKYNTKILGFGSTGWEIVADDAALQQRLQARGVIDLIERLGATPIYTQPTLDYKARNGALLFREEVAEWIPTPERFKDQLETLLLLAQINTEVNPT
ncbi:MAG: hypothetical protein JOZ51_23705 [Chloroflexi bacterium]|nr:hypothetical protein [Chloroflexota bacterium]